jgi:glyoxylase-like metal-dependent hydrolase (beta-lactamase superfamily II)
MKTAQISPRITQLTKWPLFFPVNVYLVREDDGFTLIDAAVGGCTQDILETAERLGAPIVRVALTHAHGDHIGSLDELRGALPRAEFLMTSRTARFLSGDTSLDPQEQHAKLNGQFKAIDTKPTETIAPGDRVGSLEVVASPGHSPDHVSFFDPRDEVLIAGDAFQTRGGMAVSGALKPLFPFPAMATWDKEAALRSAQSLRALNPSVLSVGHGDAVKQPGQAMEQAIADAERRLSRRARHAG